MAYKGKASWEQVKLNPTLYKGALTRGEGNSFDWRSGAVQPHSSKVYCVSAFGVLRKLSKKDKILSALLDSVRLIPPSLVREKWKVELEYKNKELLNEKGKGEPTNIDVFCYSKNTGFCIESKFLRDAKEGLGKCGQTKQGDCAGYFGPGSDIKNKSRAWCRLEYWDGKRSPRTYWSLGKSYFKPAIFQMQKPGEECPFKGSNYQLMRNFLFSAASAEKSRKSLWGVIVICPKAKDAVLKQQLKAFREKVLLSEFRNRVQICHYEDYISLLRNSLEDEAMKLAEFLEERIQTLIR